MHHRETLKQNPPIGIGQISSDIEFSGQSIDSPEEFFGLISEMEDRIDELEHEVADLRTVIDESEEKADENPREDEFAALDRWLQENGPQSDDAQEILLTAAQILNSEGPLKTSELKDRLTERYPEASTYASIDTLWASTVERLYEVTPGFEKPGYGAYNFDITRVRK
ncbi:hypothetical protein ACOZ4L_15995 (plasmid) [Haloplanus ruber]|uniref:HTH HARE-type domain-containing protein n=1 Tax=Haloplanus ruber TaxID=869892 RepID=A0ABD6D212_9EURY|nr:hypothetical protein [Haloplanus ruber]